VKTKLENMGYVANYTKESIDYREDLALLRVIGVPLRYTEDKGWECIIEDSKFTYDLSHTTDDKWQSVDSLYKSWRCVFFIAREVCTSIGSATHRISSLKESLAEALLHHDKIMVMDCAKRLAMEKSKVTDAKVLRERLMHYYEFDLGNNLISELELDKLIKLYLTNDAERIAFLDSYIEYLIEINA
tara:strand:+ start:57 stop:617 length:561 start_codon:yes stop_codon:yes gene_type:complete